MRVLFSILFGIFIIVYMLCGCASLKGELNSSPGVDSALRNSGGISAQAPEPNQTKVPATASENEPGYLPQIPENAQVCRLDSGPCVPIDPSILSTGPEKQGPVAQIPETSFDFGTTNGDAVLTHKFVVKNAGTSDLLIKKIFPD